MSNVKFTISGFILKYLTLDRKQNKKYVLLSRMYAYNMGRIVASPIKMLKSLILFRDIYLTTEDVDVKFINKMLDMTAMYEFFLAKRSQESLTYIRDMVIHIYKISSDVNQDLIYIIDNWRTFLSSNPPKAIYQNDVSDNIIKYVKRYVVKHLKTLVKPLDEFVSDIIYECPDDLNLLHYCNYICQSLNSEIGSPFFTERIIDRINNGTITLRQFFDDGWDFYVDNINKRDNARTHNLLIFNSSEIILSNNFRLYFFSILPYGSILFKIILILKLYKLINIGESHVLT
jgi:hypothetical protein